MLPHASLECPSHHLTDLCCVLPRPRIFCALSLHAIRSRADKILRIGDFSQLLCKTSHLTTHPSMVREKRQRTADKEEPATSTGKAGAPTSLHEACCKVVRELRKHAHAAPFNQPVSPEEASDYAEVLAAASTQVCIHISNHSPQPKIRSRGASGSRNLVPLGLPSLLSIIFAANLPSLSTRNRDLLCSVCIHRRLLAHSYPYVLVNVYALIYHCISTNSASPWIWKPLKPAQPPVLTPALTKVGAMQRLYDETWRKSGVLARYYNWDCMGVVYAGVESGT